MNKKLSELSKPVATVDVQRGRQDGNIFAVAWSSAGHALPDGPHFTYSQEYVSALLAELEAKDKRIAELESDLGLKHVRAVGEALIFATDRNSELEAKLATPVRLPEVLFIKVSGSAVPVMHAERVKERIRDTGFKCAGDE